MSSERFESVLAPYNPWWQHGADWENRLPTYRRSVVSQILRDLKDLPQIVSVTGPRRVGKTTSVHQVISHLVRQQKVDPQRILYFSMDDPELYASPEAHRAAFDHLVEHVERPDETSYVFLDEVQRLPRWELLLKKAYDLRRPVRFIISGSASSPIFRASQESLLGRIKDRHLLPFSFREYCEYQLRDRPEFAEALNEQRGLREALLEGNGSAAMQCLAKLAQSILPFGSTIDAAMRDYFREGGFPEVWSLPDSTRKTEYLMEQQVRKVLYEDLRMVTSRRKPENVLRFFIYLLAHPGIEINTARVSSEAGVEKRVIDENLPLLEMTDLILRIGKFSHQPFRVRRGNSKTYPVDIALRNAVLKTQTNIDDAMGGLYAENTVIRELSTWPEKVEISYFRERNREVDFVLTHGGDRHLPIEVKYRKLSDQIDGLKYFMKRYKLPFGVVITRDTEARFEDGIVFMPLSYFLLASTDARI